MSDSSQSVISADDLDQQEAQAQPKAGPAISVISADDLDKQESTAASQPTNWLSPDKRAEAYANMAKYPKGEPLPGIARPYPSRTPPEPAPGPTNQADTSPLQPTSPEDRARFFADAAEKSKAVRAKYPENIAAPTINDISAVGPNIRAGYRGFFPSAPTPVATERVKAAEDRASTTSVVPQAAMPYLDILKERVTDPLATSDRFVVNTAGEMVDRALAAPNASVWPTPLPTPPATDQEIAGRAAAMYKQWPALKAVRGAAQGVAGAFTPTMLPFWLAGPEAIPLVRAAAGIGFTADMAVSAVKSDKEAYDIARRPTLTDEAINNLATSKGVSPQQAENELRSQGYVDSGQKYEAIGSALIGSLFLLHGAKGMLGGHGPGDSSGGSRGGGPGGGPPEPVGSDDVNATRKAVFEDQIRTGERQRPKQAPPPGPEHLEGLAMDSIAKLIAEAPNAEVQNKLKLQAYQNLADWIMKRPNQTFVNPLTGEVVKAKNPDHAAAIAQEIVNGYNKAHDEATAKTQAAAQVQAAQATVPPQATTQHPALNNDRISEITNRIAALDPDGRAKAIILAHDYFVKAIHESGGRVVGPDGKLHVVSPDKAGDLAAKWINDGIDDYDKRLAEAQKAAEVAKTAQAEVDTKPATAPEPKAGTADVPRGTVPETVPTIEPETQAPTENKPPQADAQYEEAKRLVEKFGTASTSLLQRGLRIGYEDAMRMIDRMKTDGLVEVHPGEKLPKWKAPEKTEPTTAQVDTRETALQQTPPTDLVAQHEGREPEAAQPRSRNAIQSDIDRFKQEMDQAQSPEARQKAQDDLEATKEEMKQARRLAKAQAPDVVAQHEAAKQARKAQLEDFAKRLAESRQAEGEAAPAEKPAADLVAQHEGRQEQPVYSTKQPEEPLNPRGIDYRYEPQRTGDPPTLIISRFAHDFLVGIGGAPAFEAVNNSVSEMRRLAQSIANAKLDPNHPMTADLLKFGNALGRAADESGHGGVNLVVEGSPPWARNEERIHAVQRGLGVGKIGEHLPQDEIQQLVDHPAGRAFDENVRGTYYETRPAWERTAEIAAKIFTERHGEYGISQTDADAWLDRYLTALESKHGSDRIEAVFRDMYDQAREIYERSKERRSQAIQRPPERGAVGSESVDRGVERGPPQQSGSEAGGAGERTPEDARGEGPTRAAHIGSENVEGGTGEPGKGGGGDEGPVFSLAEPPLNSADRLGKEETPERSKEAGFAATDLLLSPITAPFKALKAMNAFYDRNIEKFIQHVGLGRSWGKIEKHDTELATMLRERDVAPTFYKEKAAAIIHKVLEPLGDDRAKEKGFVLMADDESRNWLRDNRPDEYAQYATDPAIQTALQRYKPKADELREIARTIGVDVIDEDYLRRVYDKFTSGIGQADAKTKGQTGGAFFDRVITPQMGNRARRTADPGYYYEHGLHEFGPSFATQYVSTMMKYAEHRVAMHAIDNATKFSPGEEKQPSITYQGKTYYRPDIADMIRRSTPGSAGSKEIARMLGVEELPKPKDVQSYGEYKPFSDKRFENASMNLIRNMRVAFEEASGTKLRPEDMDKLKGLAGALQQQAGSVYALPKDIADALNNDPAVKEATTTWLAKSIAESKGYFQRQIVGFGFGVPHYANLMRRVAQSAPGGVADPRGWVSAVKVALSKELEQRGIAGVDDPGFEALLKHGGISPEGVDNYKQYVEANLNPKTWLNAFKEGGRAEGQVTAKSVAQGVPRLLGQAIEEQAKIGHQWLFKPGGVDQRARLWLQGLLKSQHPELSDERIAQAVNEQLGRYNQATFTDIQKQAAKYMTFPGWDFGSMAWVLRHPIKTAVAPAILSVIANQTLYHLGLNRNQDKWDPYRIHVKGRAFRSNFLSESLAEHTPVGMGLRYASASLAGRPHSYAEGKALEGLPADVAAWTLRPLNPIPSTAIDLAYNREYAGSERPIYRKGELYRKGAAPIGNFLLRRAVPAVDIAREQQGWRDPLSAAGRGAGVTSYPDKPHLTRGEWHRGLLQKPE